MKLSAGDEVIVTGNHLKLGVGVVERATAFKVFLTAEPQGFYKHIFNREDVCPYSERKYNRILAAIARIAALEEEKYGIHQEILADFRADFRGEYDQLD